MDLSRFFAANQKDAVSAHNALVRYLQEALGITVGPGLVMPTPRSIALGTLTGNDSGFWARITASAASGDRWTYSWAEAEKSTNGNGGWTDKSGGRSGTNTAFNGAENPSGVQPRIDTNSIVYLRKVLSDAGAIEYWFSDSAIDYTGQQVVTDVTWNGTTGVLAKTTRNLLIITPIGSESTTTIDTAVECP